LLPGQATGRETDSPANQAAGDGNLNYAQGDRFSTPSAVQAHTDVEFKKGISAPSCALKAWYDESLNDEEVRVGHQANNFNGTRPRWADVSSLDPVSPRDSQCRCLPFSLPGQNVWQGPS